MSRDSLPILSKENDDVSLTALSSKSMWKSFWVVAILGAISVFVVGFEAGKRSSGMDGEISIKKAIKYGELVSVDNERKEAKGVLETKGLIFLANNETNQEKTIEIAEKTENVSLAPQQDTVFPSLISCQSPYRVIALNGEGNEILSRECLDTPTTDLASILPVDDGTVGVLAFGLGPGGGLSHLEELADIVDNFLTPRLEWRIVAERFGDPSSSSFRDELFYDPIIHISSIEAMDGSSRFLTKSAVVARKTLLGDFIRRGEVHNFVDEEAVLKKHGIDFLLVRIKNEKIVSFADGLRRQQFPSEENCKTFEERTMGRTFMSHGGARDFLGALTDTSTNNMKKAFHAGVPYLKVLPRIWGRVYHFDNCTSSNGIECGFLPVYGGDCLNKRVQPSIECMSQFQLGPLENLVLPKDGIPESVCQESIEQLPVPTMDEIPDDKLPFYSSGGPPNAYREWCPNCGFGGEAVKPPPESLGDSTAVFSMMDVLKIDRDLPIRDYHDKSTNPNYDEPLQKRKCAMELPSLDCSGHTCCFDEPRIPQNVLGAVKDHNRPQEYLLPIALSAFLTRFNRASRIRVARLHQPRVEAIHSRQQGWDEALATGNCATLHIRRGDNIDRCNSGETHFCVMDLTLEDYMIKAVPMLEQLNQSKHVFVMTDDPGIVTADKLAPWIAKGYFLEIISGHNQYSSETYSDYDPFLESLYAAESCRAMVGHYISSVSQLVYRKMCARWAECPIVDMMKNPPPKHHKT